jgi:hypothetical protein
MLIRVERYRSEGKLDGGVGIEAARVDYSEEHSWYSGRAGKGLVGTSTTTRYRKLRVSISECPSKERDIGIKDKWAGFHFSLCW